MDKKNLFIIIFFMGIFLSGGLIVAKVETDVSIMILEDPNITLGDNQYGNDILDDDRTVWATLFTDPLVSWCEINWEGTWQQIDKSVTSESYVYSTDGLKTVYYRCYDSNNNSATVNDEINIIPAECEIDEDCNDGLYCNGAETCSDGTCVSGTTVSCTENDVPEINTCTNNPDNNPFTWDYFVGFTSQCIEPGVCTAGTALDITHSCNVATCGATCDATHACTATDCDFKDGCVGKDYYDYADVSNTCTGCECTSNSCGTPSISYNDLRCFIPECTGDYQCAHLNEDNYCDGTNIKYREGKCINYKCTAQTFVAQDCNDGLYCNGAESCNPSTVQCVSGTTVSCSAYNIFGINTCTNNPDGNPLTLDFRNAFTSTCNEASDSCTTGSSAITSTCDKTNCNAQCSVNADCNDNNADTQDTCSGCTCSNVLISNTFTMITGWNTITLTVQPTTSSVPQIFSSINGKYKNVWVYRNNQWLSYSPSIFPWTSSLKNINKGEIVYIEMTQSGTLTIPGSA